MSFPYDDIGSDNVSSYSGGGEVNSLVTGTLSASTVGGWDDWSKLRTLNYLLEHTGTVEGDSATINNYIGIARFFRAWFYFNKVKRYSNVPWINSAMSNEDTALLYKAEDPRSLVVDSIVNDLLYAVDHITTAEGNHTRVTKWSALALMSRFCLYEGTYRKYHSELNLPDGDRFLNLAVTASEDIMNSGKFQIVGVSGDDYGNLFASASLADNKEIIQWNASDKSLGVGNNSHTVLGWQWSLSRSLEESYLMKDGTLFSNTPGHDTMGFVSVFKNRDPRLLQTIAYPGFSNATDGTTPYLAKPNLGGYDQIKFYPKDAALRGGWGLNYTGLPLFRYAEVLLNYIEAKAELNAGATQSDLDMTVNLLRKRVGMPTMNINSAVDPILAAYYPNVSGSNKGLLLELRRERRVELACEGLRLDDLNRWYAGKRIADAQQGMYVKALGALDLTGDGLPDIAILPSPSDSTALASLTPTQKANISARFYLKSSDGTNNNFYLTNSTSGYIAFTADKTSVRSFVEPQYYYRPIPLSQIVLNPNLQQPYGW
ncbi:RagB/SusD family nutrient uptake outer membrane protein [Polluticoccus soli]